jgi:superfamily II DNA or RNA helicase
VALRSLPSADDSGEGLAPIEECDLLLEALRARVPPETLHRLRALDLDTLRERAAEFLAAQEETRESLSEVMDSITTARQARSAAMGAAIRAALEDPGATPLPRVLREHQEETLARTADFLSAGHQRGLIVLPTGTGKTVIMSSILRLTGARALIVVPTKPILAQTIAECGMYLDAEEGERLPIGHVSTVDPETVDFAPSSHHAQIVVTTLNSLRLRAAQFAEEAWDLVFIDEAHTAVTQNVQQSLRLLGGVPKIGFTATPDYIYTSPVGPRKNLEEVDVDGRTMWRDINRSASRYFPHEIVRVPLREAISEGLVCPVRAAIVRIDVPLDDVPINDARSGEPDYNEAALAERFDRRWDAIAGAVLDVYTNPKQTTGITGFEERRAMAVLPTVAHAERLAAELRGYGLTAAAISGRTPDTERDAIFEAHRRGEIQILTSVKVLSLGWDSPETEVLLMLRPTRSRLLYEQLLGRVLRLNPDDPGKEALVLDFLGTYVDHAPLTAPTLFGEQSLHNGQLLVEPRAKQQPVVGSGGESLAPRYDVSTELIVVEEGKREVSVAPDADGFVLQEGIRLGTIRRWASHFGVAHRTIGERLRAAGIQSRVLYVSALQAFDFYPEAAVRAACADLLDTEALLEQDDGMFREGETVYGTARGFMRMLGVSEGSIAPRIEKAQIPARRGRTKGNQAVSVYPEAAVRAACADLLSSDK